MFSLAKENIKIAFDSIKSQLLRTILTVLIIAIGIMALVGILSGVSALENTISGSFSSMGANTFNFQRYEFTAQRQSRRERQKINPVINYRNVKDFEDNYDFPFTKVAVSFMGTFTAEVKYENKKTDPEVRVLGANENFIENSGLEIDNGRSLNVFDIENSSAVCVVGSDLQKALFPDDNPINKTISVRGSKFKIIGVLKEKGSTFGNNQDLRMIIPIQKARSIFTNPNINYTLSVKVDKQDMLEGAQDDAILTFRNIRGLNPVEKNDFGIERSDDLLNRAAENTSTLYIAAWIISIITIFGSTIALMNIMLVSVTERTREIGVRKALGAKAKTIAFQFFMETIIIGQLGGIIGIALGILIGWGVAKGFELDFSTPWVAMIWATTIAFIVAVISGLYPATKAAKLDPIESLRYE
ncbi:ABC transporter permease [Winogradskyella echinorum]|uniref:ABC transporter permease n=1 Tax=Winogradskyella echinorum TaxID=538189 RepID=A0ABR6Y1X1_9FLAO|nr:ABC transporter permease [Winogradskyella echinorum]MBC3846736.1 ABC transporter permease [Winogradskyella echinorum]MBC5751084.1 ABC transporter permease [Winogradskyella echinorum]